MRTSYEAAPRPIRIVYYGARREFMEELARTGFSCREVYSVRPLAAQGNYRGFVFCSHER